MSPPAALTISVGAVTEPNPQSVAVVIGVEEPLVRVARPVVVSSIVTSAKDVVLAVAIFEVVAPAASVPINRNSTLLEPNAKPATSTVVAEAAVHDVKVPSLAPPLIMPADLTKQVAVAEADPPKTQLPTSTVSVNVTSAF